MNPHPANRSKALAFRVATFLAVGMLSACASHPIPELQLAASRDAIEAAATRPAAEAGVELSRAREKMALARHLAADGQGQSSRWLAEQAEVDAQLAKARTNAALATREAQLWQASLVVLRERIATTPFARESRR